MRKLTPYLKPFIGAIILAVALLFVQAMSDLNLPNFMSDIVNVGIQQKGIEHASPEAIDEEIYTLLNSLVEQYAPEDAQAIQAAYTSEPTARQSDRFPGGETAPAYFLKEDANREALDTIFSRAVTVFNSLSTALTEQGVSMEDLQSFMGMENQAMPTDATTMMMAQAGAANPQSPLLSLDLNALMDEAVAQADATPESTREQIGAAFVGATYDSLGADTEQMQMMYILRIGAAMLGLSLLGVAASIGVGYLASKIAAGAARALRGDLFKKVESFSNTEFDHFSTASLITRSTNDVTQLQTFIIMGIRMICYAPIIGIGGIIMALKESTSMAWVVALAVIVLFCVIGVAFTIVMPKFKIVQKLIDRLNLVMRENLNGMSVVRAFGNQAFETKRFKEENTRVTKNNLFINRAMAFMMPAMMFIMNGVSLLIVWVGAHQIESATMQVGNMMAFMQYAMQIIMAFLMIAMMFIMVPRASVSGERIAEVLETEPAIKTPENPKKFPGKCPGKLVFDHVSFKYKGADEPVLEDISFTAEPGKTTAFIGATGAGKSTLLNLIPRFYDVTEGQITIDDTDIRDVSLYDLREAIGYVPQKGILFSGDIRSNLTYGKKDASDEEIAAGAAVAQATEFIEANPAGYHREIAQGGDNVSGGQKQRLSIARALVKKPDIYLFDDSFSALDFKTDAKLRAALKGYTDDATVLIVAQRINTIMHAEQIIVLEEGRIVGCGTHEELLKNCPTYQEIAQSQLSKEELGHVE